MSELCVLLDGSSAPGREEIGGKAWSLARMQRLGLPSPPAFVLSTRACRAFHDAGGVLTEEILVALRTGIDHLEERTGRSFGGTDLPLLVSVRSGAPVSMPGMMDTVLNVGLSATSQAALAREIGAAAAADVHRRFTSGFARTVLKADAAEVPEDPWAQLRGATAAVLGSWHTRRARTFRRHAGISEELGTAVTVQAMVFGNLGEDSGTGVLFSRDPNSGAPVPYGEYLPGGQGEDVVSGEHDPLPLARLADRQPAVHAELIAAAAVLEQADGDVQDIEFTVERGRLYLLQARTAKRSAAAAVRLAVELCEEGLISRSEALRRVSPQQVRQLMAPRLDPAVAAGLDAVAEGEPASPGVGAGLALADGDEVVARAEQGQRVVFLARTTSPEDVHAMIAATAVCTETGGATSHAAVVCRGLGRPAVVGCGAGTVERLAGRVVTVEGGTGRVFDGEPALRVVSMADDRHLRALAEWAAREADVEVVAPAEVAPGCEVRDLDGLGIVEAADVEAAVAGAGTVAGAVLEGEGAVAAALRAGVRRIVTPHVLPALLAAAAYRRTTGADGLDTHAVR